MAAKSGKSGLLAKYGESLARAHESHKTDETEFSQFGELPPGINGGIAQLVECKFDVYKKGDNVGEYFFYAAATVIEPTDHSWTDKKTKKVMSARVAGLRTSIGPEALCDTPGKARETQEEHLKWVLNEMRKMGVDTSALGADDLEAAADAIKQAAPYIRFRTWQGEPNADYPDPRTNHTWNGTADGYVPGDTTSAGVNDKAAPSANGAKPQTTPPTTVPATSQSPESTKTALETLVAAAMSLDESAQDQLSALAEKAGATEAEITAAKDWKEVADLALGKGQTATAVDPGKAEAPPWQPEKEEFYGYKPFDTKRKRKSDKTIECEVIAVEMKSRTCTLRNADNQKITYDAVPWDDLESAPQKK